MKKRIYIFILCPPFQGSTMIVNLLNSSSNVSTLLDKANNGESQWLYKNNGDENYEKKRWDPEYKLDMKIVDNVFNTYFDKKKIIWVEKSPPHICRAKMFQDYFSKLGDVFFIVSIRNPYSTGYYNAQMWVKYAKYQKHNLENLKNVIYINYEECCNNIENVIYKIKKKIPELGEIFNNNNNNNINRERYNKIHPNKVNRILNKEQKNKILKNNVELMKYFGYDII